MPKAVLIGPPGAGKSSVGRQLAKLWDCEVFDSDSEIERVSGKKIADIFTDDGEPAFREIEREVVLKALCFVHKVHQERCTSHQEHQ